MGQYEAAKVTLKRMMKMNGVYDADEQIDKIDEKVL
jgi:hypothetical protein